MKKKIILALLASLCVAASAAGITACSNKDSGSTRDPALYAAYQAYAADKDDPMTYEEWLADILAKFESGGEQGPQGDVGDAGDSIETVNIITISDKDYYEFIFTSGRIIRLSIDGEDRQETTAFTINAVDLSGNPVADAYFNIGYYDAGRYQDLFLKKDGSIADNVSEAYAIRTDDSGKAIFNVFLTGEPQSYSVFIADPSTIQSADGRNGIPDGYSVSFGYDDILGMPKNSAPFAKEDDFSYSVTVNFRIDNSWATLYDENNDLHYNRYVKSGSSEITEDHTPYVKSVAKGKPNYFTLMPFPYNLINEIDLAKSYKAAEGVYRVTLTADNARADVELCLYDFYGTPQTIKTNSDSSPADSHVKMHSGNVPTDQTLLQERYEAYTSGEGMLSYGAWLEDYAKTFSGSNYVDVEITEDFTGINFCLAYIADTDCEVTVTVKRIGDAAKWTMNEVTVPMPAGATKAQDNPGRVMLAPLDSAIVSDSKGNYHIDSVTGPMVYVQLKNATRANSYSMVYLADYQIETDGKDDPHRTVFKYMTEEFNEATNSGVRTITDYSKVVLGYGNLANSDGLYPVNDILRTILEEYCRGYSNDDNYWLAACSYYGPVPDGTEEAPYESTVGSTDITLNGGSAYVYFTATTTGYYGFYSEDGSTLSGIEGTLVEDVAIEVTLPDYNTEVRYFDVIYVEIAALQDIVFSVSKSGVSTANVTVLKLIDGNHPVLKYDDSEADLEHAAKGTAKNPYKDVLAGVLLVTVDLDAYNDYIEVDLMAPAFRNGNYKITVFGSATATVINESGENLIGKTIALTSSTAVRIRITDLTSGTFILNVSRVV